MTTTASSFSSAVSNPLIPGVRSSGPSRPSGKVPGTYETSNRKLENFLFVHDIFHTSFYKSPVDGLTIWVYEDSEELRRVVAEYLEIAARRTQNQRQRSPYTYRVPARPAAPSSRYLN